MNTNYSMSIRKNSRTFLGMLTGTIKNCLMKKPTGAEKSHNTAPLIKNCIFYFSNLLTEVLLITQYDFSFIEKNPPN